MLTLSIVAMLAASGALPSYNLPPARASVRSKCAGKCARRYRLSATQEAVDTQKYRALKEDGTACNVVRAKICRNPPRTWVRASY